MNRPKQDIDILKVQDMPGRRLVSAPLVFPEDLHGAVRISPHGLNYYSEPPPVMVSFMKFCDDLHEGPQWTVVVS